MGMYRAQRDAKRETAKNLVRTIYIYMYINIVYVRLFTPQQEGCVYVI